jgi:hypothetical protein
MLTHVIVPAVEIGAETAVLGAAGSRPERRHGETPVTDDRWPRGR